MGCVQANAKTPVKPGPKAGGRKNGSANNDDNWETRSDGSDDSCNSRHSNTSVLSCASVATNNSGECKSGDPFTQNEPQGAPLRLFEADEDPNDAMAGVILTIYTGCSYDEMFRKKKPETVSGQSVRTYVMCSVDAGQLHAYLRGAPIPQDQELWRQLVEDMQRVNADGVVLNWECCSGCGDCNFPTSNYKGDFTDEAFEPEPEAQAQCRPCGPASDTMQLIGEVLRRGHTVICSDFSLKSLIWEWSEEHLGPNPFLKMGGCSGKFQLDFDPADLKNNEVPQQLQVVGELCKDRGFAHVIAMGDTIVYTVNPHRPRTDAYNLKVLTVATKHSGTQIPNNMKCSIGQGDKRKRGTAGHVSLTYASGGQLITSMSHWIELTRVHTSFEEVCRVAAGDFGDSARASFCEEYESLPTQAEKDRCVQRRARSLISKSVPTRMKEKAKFY